VPKYFSDFVYRLCHAIEDKISNNSMCIFERKLKTASTQFINRFPNQKPGFDVLFAAGLPHFSSGWARCWGRDTFTSN
jgi:glycogen debranching enzyme